MTSDVEITADANRVKHDPPDLHAQNEDLIHNPQGIWFRAVSMDYIIEHNSIPDVASVSTTNIKLIDLSKDDSFTKALKAVEAAVIEKIEAEHCSMLEEPVWSKEDRITWESSVSQMVSDEMGKIDGLDTYRNRRIEYKDLNDLSSDIDNDTTTEEFDCDIMSVAEGVVLQRLEYRFLGKHIEQPDPDQPDLIGGSAEPPNWKAPGKYYLTIGNASVEVGAKPGGHGFIVSGLTGNVIEATVLPGSGNNVYLKSADPNHTFKDFMNGTRFVTEKGEVYSTNTADHDADHTRARLAAGVLTDKDIEKIDTVKLSIGSSQPMGIQNPEITFSFFDRPDSWNFTTGLSFVDPLEDVAPVAYASRTFLDRTKLDVGMFTLDPGHFRFNSTPNNGTTPDFETIHPGLVDHSDFRDYIFGARAQTAPLGFGHQGTFFSGSALAAFDDEGNGYFQGKSIIGNTRLNYDHDSWFVGTGLTHTTEDDQSRLDVRGQYRVHDLTGIFGEQAEWTIGTHLTHEMGGNDPTSLGTLYTDYEMQELLKIGEGSLSVKTGIFADTEGDIGGYVNPRYNYEAANVGVVVGQDSERGTFGMLQFGVSF